MGSIMSVLASASARALARAHRNPSGRCGSRNYVQAITLTALSLGAWSSANAQLNDCQQIDGGVPNSLPAGSCIGKPLADQVGSGQGDEFTPGSSIYLIKRDPARSIRRGRQLFQRKFSLAEGQGPRDSVTSTGDIIQNRRFGAGLADSCAACHGRPRGSAGFGGDVVTRPDSRDAPHLFGLGLIEQLGDEMTSELRAIRQAAIDQAANGGGVQTLFAVDFDASNGSFAYQDDVFGTNQPSYAASSLQAESPGDLRAVVALGGVNGADITDMSGGWVSPINLSSAGSVRISFDYRLVHDANFESDEFVQAIVDIDGQQTILATLTGNGNGGSDGNTGVQVFELNANLAAGTHILTLGGFLNKKTTSDEVSFVSFDDVVVELLGGGGGQPVTLPLVAKGIDFGTITANPDGSVDTSNVQGINTDLRLRPFFHQGGTVSMREFIVGAFKDEMGLEVVDPILCAVTDPNNPVATVSPSGFVYDPDADVFERPPVCSAAADGDNDGVTNEIDTALLDHMEFYLLNYFKPGQYRVTSRAVTGRQLMGQIGCTGCHVADLTIDSDRRVADVETTYDPSKGIFNDLFANASTRFEPFDDGETFPQLLPQGQPFVVNNFFSDLKRHDLGPAFHEREWDGSIVTEFITEPLWGVGSTAPYGHDGRSINLDAVIRRHGGEALASRDDYLALSDDDQRKIQEFLQTLVLFPPDDTASNLKPGDPSDEGGIQDPDVHGTINLGELFQISSEGPE